MLHQCSGLVLLGETSKFISASITRITSIACDGSGGGKVALVGGAGESVTLSYAIPTPARVVKLGRPEEGGLAMHSATCTINARGVATMSLPSGTCT